MGKAREILERALPGQSPEPSAGLRKAFDAGWRAGFSNASGEGEHYSDTPNEHFERYLDALRADEEQGTSIGVWHLDIDDPDEGPSMMPVDEQAKKWAIGRGGYFTLHAAALRAEEQSHD